MIIIGIGFEDQEHSPFSNLYILEKGKAVPCSDCIKWSKWMLDHFQERQTAYTRIGNKIISTVFLGMTHGQDDKGRPYLWETMEFGRDDATLTTRYTSEEDAKAGHQQAVVKNTRHLWN